MGEQWNTAPFQTLRTRNAIIFNRYKRARPQVTWIVDPDEVEPVEHLADLVEINSKNLAEFVGASDKTPESGRKALNFLAKYSVIHNTRECSVCDGQMTLVKDSADKHHGVLWQCPPCKAAKNRKKIRVRDDSFFESMHLTIQQVLFLAAGWVENPGKRILDVAKEHGVGKDIVGHLHNWFRDLTQQWWDRSVSKGNGKLGGPGKIVEIDETLMYKAKYNLGKSLLRPQIWVFGMIERGTNKVAMMRVDKRDAATLLPIIQKHILPGTLILSDGWAAYGGIKKLQTQYDHDWVNHKVNFVDPDDRRVHTQSIEATWGAFKRQMKARFGDPADRLDGHMTNYMFRRAHDREKLLNLLIIEMKYYRRDMSERDAAVLPTPTQAPAGNDNDDEDDEDERKEEEKRNEDEDAEEEENEDEEEQGEDEGEEDEEEEEEEEKEEEEEEEDEEEEEEEEDDDDDDDDDDDEEEEGEEEGKEGGEKIQDNDNNGNDNVDADGDDSRRAVEEPVPKPKKGVRPTAVPTESTRKRKRRPSSASSSSTPKRAASKKAALGTRSSPRIQAATAAKAKALKGTESPSSKKGIRKRGGRGRGAASGATTTVAPQNSGRVRGSRGGRGRGSQKGGGEERGEGGRAAGASSRSKSKKRSGNGLATTKAPPKKKKNSKKITKKNI